MDNILVIWDSFLSVLKTFRIKDIIDIVLVAYLIYKGIKLVRETRAEQLVKGIAVLSFSFFIASALGLRSISFLLENLFQIGIIAIIVVFQPELRRALEKVGRTKVYNLNVFNSNTDELDKLVAVWDSMIKIICNSADVLSKSKTGALIVFERQTKLGEQISTGVEIHAKPSEELIGNIFFHNSPLHDGAVIIRDGKILAASCFLPKPGKEEFMDRNLGSRHRAAIGMSENSDAIVLVVSEETGSISVAENGVLIKNLDKDSLAKILYDGIIPKKDEDFKEKKSKFWRFGKK